MQLATLRQSRANEVGAEDAWRHAAESASPIVAAQASFGLGVLLRARGDVDGARLALERVLVGPEPMAWRARALLDLPSPSDVRALLERGAAEGHADASFDLAWWHYHEGELGDAVLAWKAAERDPGFGPLAKLERMLATDRDRPRPAEVVYDALARSMVFALGQPAGQLGEGGFSGTEADLLHFTIDADGNERVMLPVFTRQQFMQDPLLRNPEWQVLSVLRVFGGSVLADADEDVTVVVNPWSRLEFEVPSYKAMILLRPNDPGPWLAMAEAFAVEHHWTEVDEAVEHALSIRADDPGVWRRIALLREGRADDESS